MITVEQKTVTAIHLNITTHNGNVVLVQDSLNDMTGSLVVEPEALPNLIAALGMIHNARILRPTQGYGYEETNETARELPGGTRHEAEHGRGATGRRRHRTS